MSRQDYGTKARADVAALRARIAEDQVVKRQLRERIEALEAEVRRLEDECFPGHGPSYVDLPREAPEDDSPAL